MPIDPKSKELLAAIRTSEFGARLARDLDEQLAAERSALAAKLATLNDEAEKGFPKHVAATEKATADLRKAEEALRAARIRHATAIGGRTAASANYTIARADLEKQLRETASPLIADFIAWIDKERAATRKAIQYRSIIERHPLTGQSTDRSTSNAASVNARLAGLLAALEAANDLALLDDQSRIPEAIDAIKSALPKIQDI